MGSWRAGAAAAIALIAAAPAVQAAPPAASKPRATALAATADDLTTPPFAFPAPKAGFATLQPTTTRDLYEPKNLQRPGTGRLSLREAFALANLVDVEVTIVLQRGAVYRLERCGDLSAAANTLNELVHTANKPITVTGNGATIVQTCDGAGVVVQQGGDQLLNLVDITIRGGRSVRTPGGGVWSSGTGEVRVSNSVVTDNQVKLGGRAQAVAAGGVAANGDVFLSGVTLTGNRSDHGAGAAAAGGALKAVKSSIYANSGPAASGLMGAKAVAPPPPPAPPAATGQTPDGVTLVYSTLSGDRLPLIKASAGTITSYGSVISGSGAGPLCVSAGKVRSLGANYASGGSGCGEIVAAADPQLVATAGMKQVEVLGPGPASPLRDAVPFAACLPPAVRAMMPVYSGVTSDQLGVPRTQGAGCDIGAIEAVAGSLSRTVASPPMSDLPLQTRWAPASLGAALGPGAIRVTTAADVLGGPDTSLRQAFSLANAAEGDSTIVLEPGQVYRLERCVPPQTAIDNQTNELVRLNNRTLTLYGNGSTIVQTCDGSAVIKSFGAGRLVLNGVTITGGRSVHPGGGVFAAGAGELRLENTWITDNSSAAAGGGIAAFGDVVLMESSVSGNHSAEFGGGVIGTADMTAVNSSIFDNTADLAIGGIGNHSGRMTLLFSTVADNTGPNLAAGKLAAFGSIVANFRAPPKPPPGMGPPPAGHGPPPGAEAPPPGSGGPPAGGFPPPSNCMIEHRGPSTGLGNWSTDASCGFGPAQADPLLVPNRAVWPTRLALADASPAIDAIPESGCAAYKTMTDQLAAPRLQGAGCDSGAVERAPANAAAKPQKSFWSRRSPWSR